MLKEEVSSRFNQQPFVPFRIFLKDGRSFDVPFENVAHLLGFGVLVLIGLKKGTHQAKTFDRFGFDDIDRIESTIDRKAEKNGRHKKAR